MDGVRRRIAPCNHGACKTQHARRVSGDCAATWPRRHRDPETVAAPGAAAYQRQLSRRSSSTLQGGLKQKGPTIAGETVVSLPDTLACSLPRRRVLLEAAGKCHVAAEAQPRRSTSACLCRGRLQGSTTRRIRACTGMAAGGRSFAGVCLVAASAADSKGFSPDGIVRQPPKRTKRSRPSQRHYRRA